MKLAIMQPYFFPYIGYFQLIKSVDKFVIYDNIQYTKKGWINRNRYLQNGHDALFTIPLKNGSVSLNINERCIADSFNAKKLISRLSSSYSRSPQYKTVMPLVEKCILSDERNLFDYIYFSIKSLCGYLDISTELQISSQINIAHELKGQEKVIEICRKMEASEYINAFGGLKLYSKETFINNGITLKFIKSKLIEYEQFNTTFVPWLSIIDVMMFSSAKEIHLMLDKYEFI